MLFSVLSMTVVGALLFVMARQGRRGTIARNGSFGIRLPAVMASDASWEAGHRAAAPRILTASLFSFAFAVLVFVQVPDDDGATVWTVVWAVGVLALVIVAGFRAHHAAKAVNESRSGSAGDSPGLQR
ncbi:SdpI family protein [Arthrobacter roseus]|uniref:SdpI family protein n=1 Tax=Arthrobacter roseus TaxID=136274 RepID=UPI0019650450|nr:SdpI family protein [Arthrobacter roseus]MBM7849577.1 putative membrane protein [Arthrobacter roseus]